MGNARDEFELKESDAVKDPSFEEERQ